MLYHSSLELIGRTPLVELTRIQIPNNNRIFAKLEGANPAGGVKDRVALHILSKLRNEGKLTQDSIIIEATAGNTGLGIAFVALHFGVQARLIVPDKFSIEKQLLMRALGAEVINTPKSEGMQGAIALARQMIEANPNAISINQFENLENPRAHYLSTAREIWEDLSNSSLGNHSQGCVEFGEQSLPLEVTPAPKSTQNTQSNTAKQGEAAVSLVNTRIMDSSTQDSRADSELQSGGARPQSSLESHDLSSQILECQAETSPTDSKSTLESALSESRSVSESTFSDSHSVIASESKRARQSINNTADSKPTSESTPPILHYFIAGAGSGGSFSGIARYLKEQDSRIQAVLCDPVGSIIGGGCEGCANIEGIGNSFIPATMDTRLIDKVIKIADEEAYAGVRLLAGTEGILAGISSGACLQACLKLAEEMSDSIIVTLFADDFSRYFSRNLIS